MGSARDVDLPPTGCELFALLHLPFHGGAAGEEQVRIYGGGADSMVEQQAQLSMLSGEVKVKKTDRVVEVLRRQLMETRARGGSGSGSVGRSHCRSDVFMKLVLNHFISWHL